MTKTIGNKVEKVTPTPSELQMTSWQEKVAVTCSVPGCGHVAANSSVMNLHKAKVHKITSCNDGDVVKQYHCPVSSCYYNPKSERYFKNMDILRVHYMKLHSEKNFKCAKCGKAFGLGRDCQRHEEECGQSFSCPQCGKVYTKKDSLMKHCDVQRHTKPTFPPKPKPAKKPVVSETKLRMRGKTGEKEKKPPAFILPKQPNQILLPVQTQSVKLQTDSAGAHCLLSKLSEPVTQAVQTGAPAPPQGELKTVSIQTGSHLTPEKLSMGVQAVLLVPPAPALSPRVAQTQTRESILQSAMTAAKIPVVKVSRSTQKSPLKGARKRRSVATLSSGSQTSLPSTPKKLHLSPQSTQMPDSVDGRLPLTEAAPGMWSVENPTVALYGSGGMSQPETGQPGIAASVEDAISGMSTQTDLSCLLDQLLPWSPHPPSASMTQLHSSHTQTSTVDSLFLPQLGVQGQSFTAQAGCQTCEPGYQPQTPWPRLNSFQACSAQTDGGSLLSATGLQENKQTQYCHTGTPLGYQEQGIQTQIDFSFGYPEQTRQLQTSSYETSHTQTPEFHSLHTQTSCLGSTNFPNLEYQNQNTQTQLGGEGCFSQTSLLDRHHLSRFRSQDQNTQTKTHNPQTCYTQAPGLEGNVYPELVGQGQNIQTQTDRLQAFLSQSCATQTFSGNASDPGVVNNQTQALSSGSESMPQSQMSPVYRDISTSSQTNPVYLDTSISDHMSPVYCNVSTSGPTAGIQAGKPEVTGTNTLFSTPPSHTGLNDDDGLDLLLDTDDEEEDTPPDMPESKSTESLSDILLQAFESASETESSVDLNTQASSTSCMLSHTSDLENVNRSYSDSINTTSLDQFSSPCVGDMQGRSDMGTMSQTDEFGWEMGTQTMSDLAWEMGTQTMNDIAWDMGTQTLEDLVLEMGTQTMNDFSSWGMASQTEDDLSLEMGTQTLEEFITDSHTQTDEVSRQWYDDVVTQTGDDLLEFLTRETQTTQQPLEVSAGEAMGLAQAGNSHPGSELDACPPELCDSGCQAQELTPSPSPNANFSLVSSDRLPRTVVSLVGETSSAWKSTENTETQTIPDPLFEDLESLAGYPSSHTQQTSADPDDLSYLWKSRESSHTQTSEDAAFLGSLSSFACGSGSRGQEAVGTQVDVYLVAGKSIESSHTQTVENFPCGDLGHAPGSSQGNALRQSASTQVGDDAPLWTVTENIQTQTVEDPLFSGQRVLYTGDAHQMNSRSMDQGNHLQTNWMPRESSQTQTAEDELLGLLDGYRPAQSQQTESDVGKDLNHLSAPLLKSTAMSQTQTTDDTGAGDFDILDGFSRDQGQQTVVGEFRIDQSTMTWTTTETSQTQTVVDPQFLDFELMDSPGA